MQQVPVIDLTPSASIDFSGGLHKGLTIYLKTTDTCQLDCDHCFTSGSKGRKNVFDADATFAFLSELYTRHPNLPYVTILLHGGEPLLPKVVDPDTIINLWKRCQSLWSDQRWSVQTNLTYSMTEKHKFIFSTVCGGSIGTSWDAGLRWKKPKQKQLWQKNVAELVSERVEVSVMVSIDTHVVKMRPVEILREMCSLGVSHVMFEKITSHGHALERGGAPSNADVNQFFEWMLDDALEYHTQNWINNTTLMDIINSFEVNDGLSTHCRDCEQKILTINADGSVAGCPNAAALCSRDNIKQGAARVLSSDSRLRRITDELTPDLRCLSCEFFHVCKGGCHQLEWQGDECPSPKRLFERLSSNDVETVLGVTR